MMIIIKYLISGLIVVISFFLLLSITLLTWNWKKLNTLLIEIDTALEKFNYYDNN